MKKLLLIALTLFVIPTQAFNSERAKTVFKEYGHYLPLVFMGLRNIGTHIQIYRIQSIHDDMQNFLSMWKNSNLFTETEQNKKKREELLGSQTYKNLNNFIKPKDTLDKTNSNKNENTQLEGSEISELLKNESAVSYTSELLENKIKLLECTQDSLIQATISLILLGHALHKKSWFFSKASALYLTGISFYRLIYNDCENVLFCKSMALIELPLGILCAYFC